MKRILLLLAAVSLVALLVGCGGGSDSGGSDSKAKYTIIYAGVSDSEIEPSLKAEINDMGSVDIDKDIKICLQYKFGPEPTTRRGIVSKGMTWDKYDTIDPKDMGSKDTLVEYINWAKKQCPAQKYILYFSSHGSGWNPCFDTKAVMHDDEGDPGYIEDYQIAEIGKECGINAVIFDNCLMACMENLTLIKDSFEYAVGSEHSICGYDKKILIQALNKGGDLRTVLKSFVTNQAPESLKVGDDIHLYDLSQIDAVVAAIKPISEFLINNCDTYGTQFEYARKQCEDFYDVSECGIVDFVQYLANVENFVPSIETDLEKYGTNLKKALDKASLVESDNTTGISVNFPKKDTYINYYGNYENTPFAQKSGWNDFLYKLYVD